MYILRHVILKIEKKFKSLEKLEKKKISEVDKSFIFNYYKT